MWEIIGNIEQNKGGRKNGFVEGLRKAIQELLVPELKALQVEVKELGVRLDQMDKRFEQMDRRFAEMQEQMDKRFDLIFKEFHSITEQLGKIETKLDFSERMVRLEGLYEEMRREIDRLFERKPVAIG
ncbi:MAG: hypothetical protein AB1397_06910 [bacterium]